MITEHFSFFMKLISFFMKLYEQISMNYSGVCFVFPKKLTLVCMRGIIISMHYYN